MELDALNEIMNDLRDAGAELVVISPQTPDHSRAMIDKHNLVFPMLYDAGLKVAEQFNLAFDLPDDLVEVYGGFGINVAATNGEDRSRLPMPARFVVHQSGRIHDAAVNPDYTQRPEPADVLPILRGIAQRH